MKIAKISQIALLGGALLSPAFAEKVQFEQLPPDLQAKVRAQTGGARIEDIDRDTRNGKSTYEVAFKNAQGQNTELVFEDTGTLVGSDNNTTVDSRKLKYSELPVAVRRAADAQISGGEVNDVERSVRNGRVTYGIGYKGPNGTGPQRDARLSGQCLAGPTACTFDGRFGTAQFRRGERGDEIETSSHHHLHRAPASGSFRGRISPEQRKR